MAGRPVLPSAKLWNETFHLRHYCCLSRKCLRHTLDESASPPPRAPLHSQPFGLRVLEHTSMLYVCRPKPC